MIDLLPESVRMIVALIVFALTFSKYRPYIALVSGVIFIVTGIGILRKEGYEVKNGDFFKIGMPFTLAAIVPAYIYIWLVYGI